MNAIGREKMGQEMMNESEIKHAKPKLKRGNRGNVDVDLGLRTLEHGNHTIERERSDRIAHVGERETQRGIASTGPKIEKLCVQLQIHRRRKGERTPHAESSEKNGGGFRMRIVDETQSDPFEQERKRNGSRR